MLIQYWCPYLTNIATIAAVKRSAENLIKYNKKEINVEIINCYGEWDDEIKSNNKFIINKPLTINLFNKLPKKKLLSKITLIILFFLSFFPLIRKINKEKPNFLVVHLLTSLPIFLSIFFNKKTKLILRISGLPKLNFFRKTFWKIFKNKIYLITTPTRLTKEDLIKENIFDENKVKILRDPVIDVNKIYNLKKEKIENDFIKDEKYYLAIGRLTKQKNFLFMITSFSEIIDKLKIKKLVIIGKGEEFINLKKEIKKLKLENNVYLLGYKNNPYKYINNCEALISTSLYEDPGFVLLESCFLNRLIISSNSKNGPRELSIENNLGYFFNPLNKTEFHNCLIESESCDNTQKIINAKKFVKKYTCFQHFKNLKNLIFETC